MPIPPRTARFLLCGLGPEPPRTATLETLLALRAASVVYGCGLSAGARALLKGFGVKVKPLVEDLVLEPGRVTALVCPGSPAFYPPEAEAARRRAESRGAETGILLAVGQASAALIDRGQILGIDLFRMEVDGPAR